MPYRDLRVRYKAGRPPTGWFGQLVRAGDFDFAGYGAQLAAQARAASRKSGRELALLSKAWQAGSRNAKLADQLSKRVMLDLAPGGIRAHLNEALDVCDEAIATRGSATGRVWDSLRERRESSCISMLSTGPNPRAPATPEYRGPSRFIVTATDAAASTPKARTTKHRKRRASSPGAASSRSR